MVVRFFFVRAFNVPPQVDIIGMDFCIQAGCLINSSGTPFELTNAIDVTVGYLE